MGKEATWGVIGMLTCTRPLETRLCPCLHFPHHQRGTWEQQVGGRGRELTRPGASGAEAPSPWAPEGGFMKKNPRRNPSPARGGTPGPSTISVGRGREYPMGGPKTRGYNMHEWVSLPTSGRKKTRDEVQKLQGTVLGGHAHFPLIPQRLKERRASEDKQAR